VTGPDDFRTLQQNRHWHEMDRNAKRFAAAILMPGEQLTNAAGTLYPKLVRVAGYGDAAAVKKHLGSLLAKQFEVSAQAMNIRLKEWPMHIADRVDQAIKDQVDYF
jgi:Zn-dependent peptidase ImmA (M78 family)